MNIFNDFMLKRYLELGDAEELDRKEADEIEDIVLPEYTFSWKDLFRSF